MGLRHLGQVGGAGVLGMTYRMRSRGLLALARAAATSAPERSYGRNHSVAVDLNPCTVEF
jgi:hypothetical protein